MSNPSEILFVANEFGVLSEVWMYRQATLMPHASVSVICRRYHNAELYPATDTCQVIELPTELIRSPLKERFGTNLLTRVGTSLLNRWQNRHFGFYPGTVGERQWLIDTASRLAPQAVLFQYGTTAVRYADIFRRNRHPYAIHFHGHDLSQAIRKQSYARRLLDVAGDAFALIACAEYMREWLIEQGISPQKVHRLPYGVPMADFKPAEGSDRAGIEFLMVGRLTSKKAPLLTLQAFAECHREHPEATLRVIGDGDLLHACRQLAATLGVDAAVNFMGAQSTQAVREAMSLSDVFVQHSIVAPNGDKEGWPVAIAEAAASGLPIVSTRHASIPEQVIHGQSGFLVEELDWKAMGQHMKALAANHSLRSQFGSTARSHIAQWDTQNQVAHLESILLEESRP